MKGIYFLFVLVRLENLRTCKTMVEHATYIVGVVDVPFGHTGNDVCLWGKLFSDLVLRNLSEFG